MCNWMSMLIDRNGKVWHDGNTTNHEELVKQSGWKDDKLENRDFVRIEISLKDESNFTAKKSGWKYKVDEKGTLPNWYKKNEKSMENKCWKVWEKEIKRCNIAKVEEFIKSFKKMKWFKPDGKPKKEWKMFYGKDWDASRYASYYASRDASLYASLYASRDASRDASYYASRDASYYASEYASLYASLYASEYASYDAALMAGLIILGKDAKKMKKEHVKHIKGRWEVWTKGYGLYCDVNGVLYVYAPEKYKPKKKVKP